MSPPASRGQQQGTGPTKPGQRRAGGRQSVATADAASQGLDILILPDDNRPARPAHLLLAPLRLAALLAVAQQLVCVRCGLVLAHVGCVVGRGHAGALCARPLRCWEAS